MQEILVVDSDAEGREQECEILREEGFKVGAAQSGEEALRLLRERHFDLVVLDTMTDSSGLETCRQIKRDEGLRRLPVVFTTPSGSPESVTDAFSVGGDDYIVKPFRREEFLLRVHVQLRMSRETEELESWAKTLERTVIERSDELGEIRRFSDAVVGALTSGVAVLDGELRVRFANGAFVELMGLGSKEVADRGLTELLPDATGKEFATLLTGRVSRVLTGKTAAESIEYAYTDPHRGEAALSAKVSPIEFGGRTEAIVVVDDATERRKAQAAILQEERKLVGIVNALNAALTVVDRGGRIVFQNPTSRQWFAEGEGKHYCEVFSQADPGDCARIFAGAGVEKRDWFMSREDATETHYSSIFAPVRDMSGEVTQTVVLTQDVTELVDRINQLALLRELGVATESTLELDDLLHLILTCVTVGGALSFNRAFFFLYNPEERTLDGSMAVGAGSIEEAYRVWSELGESKAALPEILRVASKCPDKSRLPLLRVIEDLRYALSVTEEIVVRTAVEARAQVVRDSLSDARVTDDFRGRFGTREFIAVPVAAQNELMGVILADNLYNGRPVSDAQKELLTMFAGQAAMAVRAARAMAELREKMNKLRAAQEALLHAGQLATIGRLAAHIAHEIRNPLSTIGGFARAIQRAPERSERVRSNAWIIAEEVKRLERILAGVMDFARPPESKQVRADINQIVERAAKTFEVELPEKGIDFFLELESGLPEIELDLDRIHQVVFNLLNNAAESMPEGGELRAETSLDGEWVHVAVSDTGRGIPEKLLNKLFEPFFTTRAGGTGLGLAVSRKIIEDHGGHIDVETRPGEGTTFIISLPLKRPPEIEEARRVLDEYDIAR